MACGKKKTAGLDEVQKKILNALSQMNEPAGCKVIAEATGLKTQQVSGKLRGLKTKGYVESPVKGKYVITENGKKELN